MISLKTNITSILLCELRRLPRHDTLIFIKIKLLVQEFLPVNARSLTNAFVLQTYEQRLQVKTSTHQKKFKAGLQAAQQFFD